MNKINVSGFGWGVNIPKIISRPKWIAPFTEQKLSFAPMIEISQRSSVGLVGGKNSIHLTALSKGKAKSVLNLQHFVCIQFWLSPTL